ncbi:hypothetical protein CCP3SC1AL1_1130002 [Gammaproteobacteria bacterium]
MRVSKLDEQTVTEKDVLQVVKTAEILGKDQPYLNLRTCYGELRVLLVEHNLEDVKNIQAMLKSITLKHPFKLTRTNQLSSALERLRAGGIDLLLLSLDLPDSKGLGSLEILKKTAKKIPVVILTGEQDEEQELEALKSGAQDYLVKTELTGPLLVRTLRYACERKHLADALEQSWQKKQDQWYSARVARCYECSRFRTPSTSQSFPACDLPEDDSLIGKKYRHLIFESIQELRTKEDGISDHDQSVARLFAAKGYGAREVVKFHQRVLREYEEKVVPSVAREFSSDARFVLIKVLGRLADIYRDWAINFSSSKNSD